MSLLPNKVKDFWCAETLAKVVKMPPNVHVGYLLLLQRFEGFAKSAE